MSENKNESNEIKAEQITAQEEKAAATPKKPEKADSGKFLKSYAIALFTVAFILVAISIYIQYTSSRELEKKVQQQVELNSNHPMIQNIQKINEHLQSLLDGKTVELQQKERTFGDHLMLEQKKSDNQKILMKVQNLYIQGKKKSARELLKTVDKNLLTDDTLEIYNYMSKKLK